MTDVCSVVASLKLTPKGRLQYNKELKDVDLTSQFSQLCVSPIVLNNTVNNNNSNNNTFIINSRRCSEGERYDVPILGEKSPEKYMNYFSPQKVVPEESTCSPPAEVSKSKNKETETFNFVKPSDNYTQMCLQSIEEEYRIRKKEQEQTRLNDYYSQILKLDSEHATHIENIERTSLLKQNTEAKKIYEDQNSACDELTYYQDLKKQREAEAAEKLRQAEIHRKEIEAKIKRDADLKREKLEKKKMLAGLGEQGLTTLNSVTQLYVQKNKTYQSDEFKAIIEKTNNQYNQLVNTVNQGLASNSDTDSRISEATHSLDVLKRLEEETVALIKRIENDLSAKEAARKEAEEKMKKLAEEEANNRKKAAEAAAAASAPTQPAATTTIAAASAATPGATPAALENELSISAAAPRLLPIESMLKPMLQMFVSKRCFRDYLRLSKLVIDTEKLHEELSKSALKEKKSYRFDITKVINTAINTISDGSPKHLMDKISRLVTLLTGKQVVNAGKSVSVSTNDPSAMALCKDLIAKQLVKQGPTLVASSAKAAFPIAAVVLGVWCSHPDVGELLMGHLYTKCPYTVPFYIPKTNEISTPDYCKLLGYAVEGNDVESEDKYLKKLSGSVRLYAAIMASDVPPAYTAKGHPHGLEHAWVWLTNVLNMEPRPVTATILFDFLEVAGHAMLKRFGGQFRKLLLILCNDVMPKILEVTPPESKAGATRLKLFLEECVKQGKVKPPEGFLSSNWYSGGSNYYRY